MKTYSPQGLFNKYAEQYQDKYMDVTLYHPSFDLFCDSIENQQASILDVGCGPGNVSQYILNKHPHYKILGIDLAENMVKLAQHNVPQASFKVMDCRDIHILNQSFDAIMCAFCFPYLSMEECEKLIRDAAQLLCPDGILYISTMADYYENSGYKGPSSGGEDQLYMYYHQADYLTEFLHQNNFILVDLQHQAIPVEQGDDTVDLIMIAKKSLVQ